VDEVPGLQPPLLVLDQEDALAAEDEEVLLVRLGVVEAHGRARLEDGQPVADLGKRDGTALEHARRGAVFVGFPLRVAHVDDEPALARGAEPVLRPLEPGLLHQSGSSPTRRSFRLFIAVPPRLPCPSLRKCRIQ
jgi:hypothetical protein